MKSLINQLPLIIGLILIVISCNRIKGSRESGVGSSAINNSPTVVVDYPQYQVKEGSVYDGDTLRVIGNGDEELKIRFACVDTREIQQSGGIEDRDFLRSLLNSHNNQVMVNITTKDRYGRSVAELFLPNGELVQQIQARAGKAFPYPRYKQDCPSWQKVESAGAIAQKERLGVWASNNPEFPWQWRKNR